MLEIEPKSTNTDTACSVRFSRHVVLFPSKLPENTERLQGDNNEIVLQLYWYLTIGLVYLIPNKLTTGKQIRRANENNGRCRNYRDVATSGR